MIDKETNHSEIREFVISFIQLLVALAVCGVIIFIISYII